MEELMKRLQEEVESADQHGDDPDALSWGGQIGILISTNEAKKILAALSTPAPLLEEKTPRWLRYRFQTSSVDDSRPVKFPPPGPYWESGFTETHATIVAYLPPDAILKEYWPEAEKLETEQCDEIIFTDRFPCPDWWMGKEAVDLRRRFQTEVGLSAFYPRMVSDGFRRQYVIWLEAQLAFPLPERGKSVRIIIS